MSLSFLRNLGLFFGIFSCLQVLHVLVAFYLFILVFLEVGMITVWIYILMTFSKINHCIYKCSQNHQKRSTKCSAENRSEHRRTLNEGWETTVWKPCWSRKGWHKRDLRGVEKSVRNPCRLKSEIPTVLARSRPIICDKHLTSRYFVAQNSDGFSFHFSHRCLCSFLSTIGHDWSKHILCCISMRIRFCCGHSVELLLNRWSSSVICKNLHLKAWKAFKISIWIVLFSSGLTSSTSSLYKLQLVSNLSVLLSVLDLF